MANSGWIKLHRKILNNPISKRPEWVWLWVYLLLKANHEDTEYIFKGQKCICGRGQLVTGRKQLSKETGISSSTAERILTYLESEHQIGQQKTSKNRIITILNYKQYQEVNNKRTTNGQQMDSKRTPPTYIQEDKEVKELKEEHIQPDKPAELVVKPYKITTPIQRIVCGYKMAKGIEYSDADWDKLNFKRCASSAKKLLEYLKDVDIVIDCISDVGGELETKGLDWTIETVCKRADEWKRKQEEKR